MQDGNIQNLDILSRKKENPIYRIPATIQKADAAPGQRILVFSDIHGYLNRLIQLLRKLDYGGDDIIVVVGDLVDKGPESLRVVQYLLDLSRRHPVYISMGNVDLDRIQYFMEDSIKTDQEFVDYLKKFARSEKWGGSIGQDMLEDLGVGVEQVTVQNASGYRRMIKEHFREELDFLGQCPTILAIGDYLFVHGGVPTDDLTALEGTSAYQYLKWDHFLEQGYGFQKYTVVTGHYPTVLYKDTEDMSPLFDLDRRVIGIDGGCGLKAAGQLNCLVLPGCNAKMEDISWDYFDEFPKVKALEAQTGSPSSVFANYFDSRVEILEEFGRTSKVRHLSTGKIFDLPRDWVVVWSDGKYHCEDYCDRELNVAAGEELSVIFETRAGRYVKKQGQQIGWYHGAAESMGKELQLVEGAPRYGNWLRERELAAYGLLQRLGIPFERIDHEVANNMEACREIDRVLDAVICKNLFLCNRQRTKFYLLMMPGNKKFKTKELSEQIGSSRLSFGEAVYMERLLCVTPGSLSVMGLMNDREGRVQLLVDRDILKGEQLGCHPCMNTSSIRLGISDLLEKFLPAVQHEPMFVDLAGK